MLPPAAVVVALLAVTAAARQDAGQRTVQAFDAPAGAVPAGFTMAASRQPSPGTWAIRRQGDGGVLTHDADAAMDGYALALAPDAPVRDVGVSVRLRLAGGRRAGGLVWRYQDPDNYYAVVLDLDRGTLSLYRFRDGNRTAIERKGDLELDVEAWHVLKTWHDGSFFYVSLGGIRVFDERDRRLDRFGPGRVGVLAAGDSTVWFDDLIVEPKVDDR